MKKIFLVLVFSGIIITVLFKLFTPKYSSDSSLTLLKYELKKKEIPSADHSKFEILQKKFTTPQQVTEACISCHTERGEEVKKSSHWNWQREEYIEGRGIEYIGKMNAINNFCIGVEGNEQSCAKCHIGFGLQNNMFSFTNSRNIDCLVCHDNTETYSKGSDMDGYPDPKIDLNYIAMNVGFSKRTNCGVCHFYGGGGNNVKHGDLEKSMYEPTKDIDVHMAVDGVNLQCADCHITEKHQMLGKVYSLSSMNRNRSTCEQCHTETPHEEDILNEHTLKVACQTCHIPTYAKVNATKTAWDWSTAGKLKDGKPYTIEDKDGNHSYMSIKGSFTWGKNLQPEYIWFNGTADHYLLGDVIDDTSKVLKINKLNGSYNDYDSKIIPVKIHRSIQPFDPVLKVLIQPKLFADQKGKGAFWQDFDWRRASEVGMKELNLPFSGKVSFIKTEMYWPINHMVSTKENSLTCKNCHSRENSRLAGLTDFYMPSRDYSPFIETLGVILILLTLIAVIVHGSFRIISNKTRK